MKKNVFSRAITVLASMAVLGAASMMTASAAGVSGGSVEAQPGDTVTVPFNMTEADFTGAELTFTCAAPLTITAVDGAMAADVAANEASGVFVSGTPYDVSKAFANITVEVAADAEPGEYPVNVSITNLAAANGDNIPTGDEIAGTVVIPAPETDEPTDAPTDAPTNAPTNAPTAAVTTVATTKAPAAGSPKTGTAGVAVAVAGLVTAGATAVVLKKKH